MFRTAIVVVATTTLLLAGAAVAQQPPAATPPPPPDFSKVEIKTTDLGDNVYMLEGQGGNITVAVGKDGIIMVDGEYAPLHDKIKAAISTVSNLPIKYLINTHFHGDHTGGNEPFARDGVTIVSEITSRSGSPPGPPTVSRASRRRRYRRPCCLPRPTPGRITSGSGAASPISGISIMPIPTVTPTSGSRLPTCCRPATPLPMAAIPISISPMAATSRA
jgi:glyoxylase-like metal-dependent hydrolase (beta-lactamase superfamily II)